jgi:outer membrane protein OmpA-like peptidoglycan-associated protein
LLHSIEQPDIHNQNADLVSSMLSAINDFVSDSFKVEANHSLGSIEVGDLSIWIERGPDSILAVAIRGEAPNSLRTQMQEILENLQTEFSDSLVDFSGDVEAFGASETILADCMQAQYQDKQKRRSSRAKWLLALLLIVLFFLLGANKYRSMQQGDYVEILNNESGYVITEAKERDGILVVRGLRDPLAKAPQAMLERSSLVSDDVIHKFEPYQSLQADFVAKRVMAILDPPLTVSIEIVEQVLVVKGSASEPWRSKLSTLAPLIGGIIGYDDSALTNNFVPAMLDIPDSVDARFEAGVLYLQGRAEQEWIAHLTDHVANYDELQRVDTSALINATEERLIAEINAAEEKLIADINALEAEVIYFDVAISFNPDQMDGDRIASLVSEIIDLSNRLGRSVLIFVKGYSDSVGRFEDNAFLSLDRADYVAQVIYLAGISPKYIEVKGLEAPIAVEANETERRQNRRVNFQVTIE